MRTFCFGILILVAAVMCPYPACAQETSESAKRKDKGIGPGELQGRWELVTARSDGTDELSQRANNNVAKYILDVSGSRMTYKFKSGPEKKGRILKCRETEGGKTWDLDFTYGEGKNLHKRVGILQVKNDQLRICFNTVVPADPSRRPKDFGLATPDLGNVLLEHKRHKPSDGD